MNKEFERLVINRLAINLGVTRMLDWLKRIATSAPREQLIKNDNQALALPTDEPVERLVNRLGTKERAVDLTQMRVIVIASQKGGAGKTTLAAHLAVRAGMIDQGPAVLVDTDPQGSLTEWWDARNDGPLSQHNMPLLATVKLDALSAKLAELRSDGVAVAIIDTPPALTASIERAIAIADLVLIPARPSPHDLRAMAATVNIARRAGKPFLFVINGAAPRANITAEAVAALSEHGRVAPVILYQRTEYASSMIDGRTVMETSALGRSAEEIAELWKYVYAQISMREAA